MIATIERAAVPALRIAGTFFLIVNVLAGVYIWRHRRRLFGRDPRVEDDTDAAREARMDVILIPWLYLTTWLVVELIGLWIR